MIAEENENVNASIEYWKTRCYVLENQKIDFKTQNASLSKQIAESCRENLRVRRITELLKNKLKLGHHKEKDNGNTTSGTNMDLFFTFPEELWPSILVYVVDSFDRLRLCDASPLLNSLILHKDKPVWLFEQVFPIMFKWLSQNEILKCRLVCKTWNANIESYLDSYEPPQASSHHQKSLISPGKILCQSHTTPPYWEAKLEPVDFDATADLNRFLADAKAHYEKYGRNLLISRSLKLGLAMDNDENNNMNDVNEFWESVINLLQVIGRHVWHIEFFNDGFEDEPASFYGLFHQMLCQLPNLKTLRVICDFDHRIGHLEHDDLIFRLGTWPPPCLPYLESLHILHSMPSSMTTTVVSCYARQIRKFVVSVTMLIQLEEEHLRGFLSLSELILRDCVKNLQEFQGLLQRLEKLESPNLEKLRLFRSYSDEEVITTDYLFGLILQKFPRLKSLDTYRMEVVVDPTIIIKDGMYLPSLKSLRIRNSSRLTYDFLLKLPNLEELCIRDESNPSSSSPSDISEDCSQLAGENDSVVDIRRLLYKRKMYESNIWGLMPSLKTAIYESFDEQVIPSGRYTREMYQFLKKQQAKGDS